MAPAHRTGCMRFLLLGSAILTLSGIAAAEPGYIAARAIAKAHQVQYVNLSRNNIHACRLVGKERQIVLFAGLHNILLGSNPKALKQPVRWNGEGIMVPTEGATLIADYFGEDVKIAPVKPPASKNSKKRTMKKRTFTVVLDPGHGDRDSGAIGGRLKEKTVNLDIAKRIGNHLKAKGVKVVFTRRKDVFIELDKRVRICNKTKPDLFVSIHADANESPRLKGSMTLYPPKGRIDEKPPIDERARREVRNHAIRPSTFGAGGKVNNKTMIAVTKTAFESNRWLSIDAAHEIQSKLVRVSGTMRRNNGVLEDVRGLRVLSRMHAPAVLVEVDFLSHPHRRIKLATPTYRVKLAKAIADAIIVFLNKSEGGREAKATPRRRSPPATAAGTAQVAEDKNRRTEFRSASTLGKPNTRVGKDSRKTRP